MNTYTRRTQWVNHSKDVVQCSNSLTLEYDAAARGKSYKEPRAADQTVMSDDCPTTNLGES